MKQLKGQISQIIGFVIVTLVTLLLVAIDLPYVGIVIWFFTGVFALYESGKAGSYTISKQCEYIKQTGDVANLEGTASVAPLVELLKELQNTLNDVSKVMEAHANKNLKSRLTESYDGYLSEFKSIVNRSASNLEFALVRISRITDGIQEMIAALTTSSIELADGSISQASSLEQISSTVMEVTNQTKNIDAKSSEGYKITQDIRDQSDASKESIEKMHLSMEDVKGSSEKIGAIIKVIDDIAFQTNLLALNAAVEAARAGQHGKGFAVVADEVRNLANRSARAAKETEELIAGSLNSIAQQSLVTDEVSSAFDQISENIEKMSTVMNLVSTSTASQSIAMSEISEALATVDEVVQGNTAISEESSSMAKYLSTDIESLQRLLAGFDLYGVDIDQSALTSHSMSSVQITDTESLLLESDLPSFPLEWKESYLIGVDEMDYHHSRLVEFINMLYRALKSRNSLGIVDAMQSLLDYTVYHFSAEEAMLQSINYPDFSNHVPRHHQFIALIEEHFSQLKNSGTIEGYGIITFLTEWLLKHILEEDMKYSTYIHSHDIDV